MSSRIGAFVVSQAFAVVAGVATAADAPGLVHAARVLPGAPPARAEAPLAVRLVWLDPADVAAGIELVARAEAESLLSRMGLTVSWRRGSTGEEAQAGEIRVILLDRGAQRGTDTPVLGATPERFAGAPLVWIHVPNVRATLGIGARQSLFALDRPAFRAVAIALGRVIAHEVVHALDPKIPHGGGLMSERLTRRQLTAASICFEPEVAFAVRAALRGDPVVPRADAGLLAAEAASREERR
jgi:hypothetical protein